MTARPSPRTVVVVLVGVALLAALVLGWVRAGATSAALDRRRAVAAVAEEFATTLLSYDHEALDATRDALAQLATPSYRDRLDEALGDLGPDIAAAGASSTATVTRVLVEEPVAGGTAHAVVVLDATVTSRSGATRELADAHLDLALAARDGSWRVDGLRQLAGEDRVAGSDS